MSDIFKKRSIPLAFTVIIIIALLLRFYQLGSNPPSLDWDEVSIGYNAYSILKTGADEYGSRFPVSFRSFDDYKPPLYVYFTVPFIAIFGLTELAVRLPAAIIGVGMVVAVYFLVLQILHNWDKRKKQRIALYSAFFLSVSPWHLQFSRAAFEGNIGICFLIIALIFFFTGLKKKWYYFLFSIFFVLSIYSYHSFRLINPVLLTILLALFYKELLKQKIIVGLSILSIIFFSLPVYINVNNSQGTGARLSMVTIFSDSKLTQLSAQKVLEAKEKGDIINQVLFNRRIIFIPHIISGYFDHFDLDFLFLHGDGGVQHHAYNMGMLYLLELPLIIIGIIYLIRKRNRFITVLLMLFLLAPVPSSVTTGTPHPVRAIAMIPGFQIFTAVGFYFLVTYLQNKKYSKILIAAVIGLFIVNIIYYLHSYYIETPIRYGYFWQYGNKEAVQFAKQYEKKYKHIIMTYTYDQPYIYYLFHNKIDPSWYQKNWNYSGNGSVDRFYRKIGKFCCHYPGTLNSREYDDNWYSG
jgi:4-amino-4-deoxy-L-arabinose transferase-like glycosyltransferase